MVKRQHQSKRNVAVRPAVSDAEALTRAVILLVIGVFGGQLMQTVPSGTSYWAIAGCVAALLFSLFRHHLNSGIETIAGGLLILFLVLCGYKAVREYTGANYTLQYEACGTPTVTNEYLDGVVFGIEWINANGQSMWIHPGKHDFNADDHKSVLAVPDVTVEIRPDKGDGENAKLDDRVDFDPPITKKTLSGTVHYEFSIGPNKDALRRTYVVDGRYDMLLTDAGTYQFRYSPLSAGSPGFIGYCNIAQHLLGRTPGT